MLFYVWQSKGKRRAYIAKTFAAFASISSGLLIFSDVAVHAGDAASSSGTAACAHMSEAMLKTARTPYSSMSTITYDKPQQNASDINTSSRTSETIFTGDAVFVKPGDSRWRKIDVEIGALQELVRKAASRFGDCQDLGNAQLEGSPVMVFDAYEGAAPSAYGTKTKLWVDTARGVLVRSETETTSEAGSRHAVIEYKYGSVTPPQL